jgi:hypothetical protein
MKKNYLLFFVAALIAINSFSQDPEKTVLTRAGKLVLLKNLIGLIAGSDSLRQLEFHGKRYALLQFERLPGINERKLLAAQGVKLYDYLPGNAFMAELPQQVSPASLKHFRIDGVYEMEPAYKISSTLSNYTPAPGKFIAVSYFGDIDRATVISTLNEAGAKVVETKIRPHQTVFIHANADAIQKIARLPFVSSLRQQIVNDAPLNSNNRAAHGLSSLNNPLGRNLQGIGVVIGVGDQGDPSTHLDFSGRLINRNPMPPTNHGTHTTGTAGGAGLINPRYKGMAPGSTLIHQYFSDILVNTPLYMSENGMIITNNSYFSGVTNCPGDGDYDILSNYVDQLSIDNPELLHVFAAGNDGLLTCSPYPASFGTIKSGFQTAKNTLSVGNISTATYVIWGTASRGPVHDGRLKPEVVAGGDGTTSTRLNNTYGQSWGSSMSAPTVTGSLALVIERYRQLNGGANPNALLLKAAACNGADDWGNTGPDFTYGFGLFNARNTVETIENNRYVLNSVTQGNTINFNITGVPAGAHQLKVLLYWPDQPAAPNAPNALVNNLDLTVTAPGPATHRPLILDPSPGNLNNLAVEGIDNRNNIEQVVIDNPPAGNFTVSVSGTAVPTGSQNYVVVWQIINPSVTLEHPIGNEVFVPNEIEGIRFNAYGGGNNTFTVEYSTNGGSTWTTINNNVPAASRNIFWTVPNLPTNQARVRVTRNVSGLTDMSAQNFTILSQHSTSPASLNVTNPCPGYINLTWVAIPSATSYEVVMLRNNTMQVMATTAGLTWTIPGLSRDSSYWVAVTPIIGGTRGRQCFARNITPSAGGCTLGIFDNDFSADTLAAPWTGRMFTSSQLGIVSPALRIRNLDNAASAGATNISYQVNGGPVVTENSAAVIPALGTFTYTFATPFNFSATGTYIVKMWVDHTGDGQKANDTLVQVVKHLENNPLTLSPDFTEGFETSVAAAYNSRTMGFDGCDRCDFNSDNSNGRARTFINTGFARTGNRAVTLDQKINSVTPTSDSLTTTFNLSGYNGADQLWLDFYYKNQGNDVPLPGNQVWIRGSDNSAWVPVFTLPTNDPTHFGVYRKSPPINITETLATAMPAQTVSSSFQVRFGEAGFTSANSVVPNGNIDDGFTFDDITLTNAQNDVGIQALVSPDLTNFCFFGTTETVQVRVKNYSNVTLNNVTVSYRINGVTRNENIATLNPGQVFTYSFTQTANLAAFQQYTIDAWVHHPADNYANNDSLTNIIFYTTPIITSYPYYEGFEGNNGYWYAGGVVSSWEWGAPAKTIINKAANGTNAWVTSLTGTYNNSELSYLYSPCFDLSAMTQPVFSFSHISRLEDDCDCDFHWVEYSLDDITWTKLGNVGSGTNWYDNAVVRAWQQSNPRWHVSSYDVPVATPKVRFRIVMAADPMLNFEGIGVDDIHVFDKAAIYTGADVTSGLVQNVNGSSWIHFTQGGRRIASINANGQNLGSTEVKVYFNNTGSDRYSNVQYYLDRNIVIQPTNAPSGNVSVRFYFTDSEANNLIGATGCNYCTTLFDAYEAGVTQYSNAPAEENGTLGDNASGIYTFKTPAQVLIAPYDNGYYAEYQVSNFSEFWINSGGLLQDRPLPMELGSFTVTKRNSTGLLEWVTLQEANTGRFIIEKSYDGTNYNSIGEIKAAGNSTISQRYRFTDAQLANGVNYYRLKLVDVNGAITYSPIRLLNISGNEVIITLYPNPVKKGLLYINTSENCRRVDISDVAGRILRSVSTQGTRQTIPLLHLSKGTYIISVYTDNGKKVEKVFVE